MPPHASRSRRSNEDVQRLRCLRSVTSTSARMGRQQTLVPRSILFAASVAGLCAVACARDGQSQQQWAANGKWTAPAIPPPPAPMPPPPVAPSLPPPPQATGSTPTVPAGWVNYGGIILPAIPGLPSAPPRNGSQRNTQSSRRPPSLLAGYRSAASGPRYSRANHPSSWNTALRAKRIDCSDWIVRRCLSGRAANSFGPALLRITAK